MPISVNEAIDRLEELDGQDVEIFGALSLEFEGTCITHIPRDERWDRHKGGCHHYGSSIWTNYDLDRMGVTEEALRQFDRRQIVDSGKLKKPAAGSAGCGHFSLWPTEMDVANVQKLETEA